MKKTNQAQVRTPSIITVGGERNGAIVGPILGGQLEINTLSLARHAAKCKVCSHAQRVEIEADFVDWESPTQIATKYNLADRASLYRHAKATGLDRKRGRNLRAPLGRIIEQLGKVKITGATVLAAIQMYAKINARGEWLEREERPYLDEFFDRMTPEEQSEYAKSGKLPRWAIRQLAADDISIDTITADE